MWSFVVVIVDVGEHGPAGLGPAGEDAGADLGFEAGEERLGDRVVEARAGPSHRRPHAAPGQGGPEVLRGVLPRSEWKIAFGRTRPRRCASSTASQTSSARMWVAMACP